MGTLQIQEVHTRLTLLLYNNFAIYFLRINERVIFQPQHFKYRSSVKDLETLMSVCKIGRGVFILSTYVGVWVCGEYTWYLAILLALRKRPVEERVRSWW